MKREHYKGKVLSVDEGSLYVYLRTEGKGGGGCAGCSGGKASAGCSVGRVEQVPLVEGIEKGDEVKLSGHPGGRPSHGWLFYVAPLAVFVFGFAVGETAALRLSAEAGGFISAAFGAGAVLLFYGPLMLRDLIRYRRGSTLRVV